MKLTNKDFKYFKKRVKYWSKVLGCSDVKIVVNFTEHEDKNVNANYTRYSDCGSLVVNLNKNSSAKMLELDQWAFHEIFEGIYLAELKWMSERRFSAELVDEEVHRSVRRAENTIYRRLR